MGKIGIRIDRDECILCGTCWEDCPEVFEESTDDGLSQVMEEYRTDDDEAQGEVPGELENCVQDAADNCPVEIIHVETSSESP
jgi:ferredoxin